MNYIVTFYNETYKILLLLIPILVSVAMIVWFDRRVWGFVQRRKGPNVVGPFGLLQTAADALKLTSAHMKKLSIVDEVIKEPIQGAHRNKEEMFRRVRKIINTALSELDAMKPEDRIKSRIDHFSKMGVWK